ncbi:XopAG/AvrGf1 family type III secretion system effector [Robbsia andropogonis]|uniref:XopAG/AvrGf1 family type III secretion system effector n=1 Tax=Robbsia andropogonis TaxID=28092 RepID=UPI0004B8CB13|nr:XopAG/AvrGf1 family type III secretion system effector [Robbsia andropogonis]
MPNLLEYSSAIYSGFLKPPLNNSAVNSKYMKIGLGTLLRGQTANSVRPSVEVGNTGAKSTLSNARSKLGPRNSAKNASNPPRIACVKPPSGTGSGEEGEATGRVATLLKGAAAVIGMAYVHDKVANHFFLSTTSLHDGKGGFTSNERLNQAFKDAKVYRQRYYDVTPELRAQKTSPPSLIKRVGNNEFVTMTDFRAATKLHVSDSENTPEARNSILISVACFTGQRIKPELVAKYKPAHVPAVFDLTKSAAFNEKNKYALAGAPNDKTGASGYVSRSATQPFVNKGGKHYIEESEERGKSATQCMQALETVLGDDNKFSLKAQLAAGQLILNLRQIFARDDHWGHAERVVLPALRKLGLSSQEEADKIDSTLLFEDPSKNVLKRNKSVAGPMLHKLDTVMQSHLLRGNPDAVEDIQAMGKEKNLEGLPIAHFKVNEGGNGFEDCSGLGDSFTCLNAVACMNYARLMSGEPRLSKDDVKVIIACLNAVYDDASSVRHTLHEVARGCFVGAGYTILDADDYYAGVCKQASDEFYRGKKLGSVNHAGIRV